MVIVKYCYISIYTTTLGWMAGSTMGENEIFPYLLNLNGLMYISFSIFQCHNPILSNMNYSIFKIYMKYWCRGFSVFSIY